ncbi:helix-turn-helix domain-containing protein [Mesorhizobium retamae]|uniref:Helix-turn-helix domain-containing protein n=1 Tax=Mesorhizobium retamae TaxID=2912854 RepID=A0ABS9QBT0_9HYPH|nr:helix-turn-helix domain-containing protein [Mesorhizobium sp. IRAMC:0171]MCG7504878.1 helix-turn-helix domain-containing protein [Mesorhizobium sp. IRAMC:0171]
MFIKTPRDCGALIRSVRRDKGMSQTELARALRTSQGWISEVEAGKPTAEIGMVLKALAILGVSIDAQPTYRPQDSEIKKPSPEDDDTPPYTI